MQLRSNHRLFPRFRGTVVTAAVVALAACGSTPVASPPDAPPAAADPAATPQAGSEWTVPRFERVLIGDTGLEAYVFKGFPAFSANTSEDGSPVASAEHIHGGFTHGVIGVRFAETLPTDDDIEAVLVGYLDFLKAEVLDVTDSVGYGHGHTLESAPSAKGVIDFGTRADGSEIAIKGWATRSHLAVVFVHGPGEYPSLNVRSMFFDGIRFPAP